MWCCTTNPVSKSFTPTAAAKLCFWELRALDVGATARAHRPSVCGFLAITQLRAVRAQVTRTVQEPGFELDDTRL